MLSSRLSQTCQDRHDCKAWSDESAKGHWLRSDIKTCNAFVLHATMSGSKSGVHIMHTIYIKLHHIILHDIMSYITSHHITSHHITSHHITSHHITSHHITSHHITSHHIISSYLILSYLVIYYIMHIMLSCRTRQGWATMVPAWGSAPHQLALWALCKTGSS